MIRALVWPVVLLHRAMRPAAVRPSGRAVLGDLVAGLVVVYLFAVVLGVGR